MQKMCNWTLLHTPCSRIRINNTTRRGKIPPSNQTLPQDLQIIQQFLNINCSKILFTEYTKSCLNISTTVDKSGGACLIKCLHHQPPDQMSLPSTGQSNVFIINRPIKCLYHRPANQRPS